MQAIDDACSTVTFVCFLLSFAYIPRRVLCRYISYTHDVLQKAPAQKPLLVVSTDLFRRFLGLEMADMALVAALLGSDYTKEYLKLNVGSSQL